MPIYEYQCDGCGERTEALQRMDEPPLTVCPRCGGVLRKLLSAPAVQFKGSGWYVTDYAGKGRSKAGTTSEKGEGSPGSAGGGADKPAAGDKGGGDASAATPAAPKPPTGGQNT